MNLNFLGTYAGLIVPILGAVLIVGVAIWFDRRRSKKAINKLTQAKANNLPETKEPEKPDFTVDARIYDNSMRTVYLGEVHRNDIENTQKACGNLGRKYIYEGKSVYALVKKITGEFVPMGFYLSHSMDNPPARLFDALQQQETHIIYDVRSEKGLLQKLGPILLFVFGVLFVAFMMVMQNRGGG